VSEREAQAGGILLRLRNAIRHQTEAGEMQVGAAGLEAVADQFNRECLHLRAVSGSGPVQIDSSRLRLDG